MYCRLDRNAQSGGYWQFLCPTGTSVEWVRKGREITFGGVDDYSHTYSFLTVYTFLNAIYRKLDRVSARLRMVIEAQNNELRHPWSSYVKFLVPTAHSLLPIS